MRWSDMPKGRKPFNWAPLMWIALMANVGAAAWMSPLTVLRTVKVEGASLRYKPYIVSIVKKSADIPAMQVDPNRVESQILASSAVESCDFRRNVFGRGVLQIK